MLGGRWPLVGLFQISDEQVVLFIMSELLIAPSTEFHIFSEWKGRTFFGKITG
jgi:hypothetical protein